MENENKKNVSIIELANNWNDLRYNVVKKNVFVLEKFDETFTDTYEVLKELTKEATIDKKYMPLITNVACFAKASTDSEDKRIRAAFILAERMLNYCISDSSLATMLPDCALIYSPVERKELVISFKDVGNSIIDIVTILE